MKRLSHIFFLVLLLVRLPLLAQDQPAQTNQDSAIVNVVYDTIYVERNSIVFTKDSVFFSERDTVIYVTDTIRTKIEEVLKQKEGEDQEEFYNRIKEAMGKRKLGERVFDWIFELGGSPPDETDSTQNQPRPPPEAEVHAGKYVGEIHLKQIDVFGPSVTDTAQEASTKLSRLYNRLHINTHDRVLYNNLLLEPGDMITPTRLADNERIIRSLPFIQDARLLVQPRELNSDTVDLLLITEDVIPYSFGVNPGGFIEGSVEIDNNNLLGTSHELDNIIIYEPDENPSWGYEGFYRIPNIRGSFIRGQLQYRNTMREDIRSLEFERRFVVPDIRYAGGIAVSHNRLTTFEPWVDSYQIVDTFTRATDIPYIRYGMFDQDYWLARSFGVKSFDNRTRLVLAARYNHRHFFERPSVAIDQNTAFHHRHFILGSLGFSKRYYTTERKVYTFGRTEDIPIGQLAEILVGPEYGEFYNRAFTGVQYSRGGYIRSIGYVSAAARWGGFWRDKTMEDGVLRFQLNSFSYMIHRRRTQYRVFLQADYTRLMNRTQSVDFRTGLVSIRDKDGVRGLSSPVMEGSERLALSLELLAYPPINFYSFRLACFVFGDAGLIAQTGEEVFRSPTYRGYGLGFRVRNENLAFKTFQMRIAFYPRTPRDESWFGFEIGSIPIPDFLDFDVRKPQVFQFR